LAKTILGIGVRAAVGVTRFAVRCGPTIVTLGVIGREVDFLFKHDLSAWQAVLGPRGLTLMDATPTALVLLRVTDTVVPDP
jgi:hypothetical protein